MTEQKAPVLAARPARPNRRPLWIILLLLLLGAGLLWLSSKLDWAWSMQPTPLRGNIVNATDGATAQPALVPLALLALAAIAALFAIGGWPRRLLGGLTCVAGLAALWVSATNLAAVFGAHPNGYPLWQIASAHLVATLAGLFVVVAGVVLVRAANQLPRLGGSYQTPGAAKQKRDPDTELWQALSEGNDPTAADAGTDGATDAPTD